MAILDIIRPPFEDGDDIAKILQSSLGISSVTSRILVNRGIRYREDAEVFLNPSINQLFDPFILHDMDKAVHRINKAIANKERITIYGDYDVDGMTSCAILFDFFTDIGCKVDVYIPNRHDEGYGINCEAIEIIHRRGTKLLISVDCGITSVSEVELAKSLGIDVIITDHHQCGSLLPNAVAVINPTRDSKLHSLHPLAGVGVAGKLVQAMTDTSYLTRYLDLIALGTVADVVPLLGDNRIFVAKGLEKINQDPCVGIEALMEVSGVRGTKINTGRIAFGLAPRLNAAGRIDDPLKGFKLLTAKKLSKAIPIARLLEEQNRQRQAIEADTIREAQEMIEKHVCLSTNRIIVLGKKDWNPGVIGIAASKITEQYYRPCLLIAIEGDLGVGSARGIDGFNIYEALKSCSHLLRKFGGHEMAAGFSLDKENIPRLREELLDYCDEVIHDSMLIPRYTYDMELNNRDITYDLVREMEALEPYGIGNPSPTFLLANAGLEQNRQVGNDGKHLKMSIELGQRLWDGIAFGMGERSEFLSAAKRASIVTGLEKNEWRGITKLQFNIKHMDILLENDKDWEEFLSFFYLKFFDAFYYDFMYNKDNNNNIYPLQYKSLHQVAIDQVVENFQRTRIGSLVLINSLSKVKAIVQDILKSGLMGKVSFSYGQPDVWEGVGVNTMIFAPAYSKIPFSNYRDIYLFEDEISYCWIDLKKIGRDSTYKVIRGDGNIGENTESGEEYLVEYADFASFYRWLRSLSTGRNIWRGWQKLVEDYRVQSHDKINGFQIRLMLKVFEELDFLKVESHNDIIKIQCYRNPISRNLSESPLFNYHRKWIHNIKKQKLKEENL